MAIMSYVALLPDNDMHSAGHCKGGGLPRPGSGETAHSCGQRGRHHVHDVLPHHAEGGAAEEGSGREDCEARHGTKKKNEPQLQIPELQNLIFIFNGKYY